MITCSFLVGLGGFCSIFLVQIQTGLHKPTPTRYLNRFEFGIAALSVALAGRFLTCHECFGLGSIGQMN
jgi:hypothetical protein